MHQILKRSIEKEIVESYINYSMNVIINRSLPDVRDGLKPVHRRILFSMYNTNKTKKYKKSARIIGEVMGKYHPHGDNAIYTTIVRMTQKFLLNIPLINGQGNFGSLDGDTPAHMRYTEIRLSQMSFYLLKDLQYNTTKFKNNYDNSEKEPIVLPTRFPNILINGSTGIAVGMTTSIPTHNVSEIIKACYILLNNKYVKNEDLIKKIPAPDFPTGGIIINPRSAKETLIKGKGLIIIRCKIHLKKTKNKNIIIVKEIPYQITKISLQRSIQKIIDKKIIQDINCIRDESSKHGIKIVIEVNTKNNINYILNKLYYKTYLQSSFHINMLILNKKKPQTMNIKNIIKIFIKFKKLKFTYRRDKISFTSCHRRYHLVVN